LAVISMASGVAVGIVVATASTVAVVMEVLTGVSVVVALGAAGELERGGLVE